MFVKLRRNRIPFTVTNGCVTDWVIRWRRKVYCKNRGCGNLSRKVVGKNKKRKKQWVLLDHFWKMKFTKGGSRKFFRGRGRHLSNLLKVHSFFKLSAMMLVKFKRFKYRVPIMSSPKIVYHLLAKLHQKQSWKTGPVLVAFNSTAISDKTWTYSFAIYRLQEAMLAVFALIPWPGQTWFFPPVLITDIEDDRAYTTTNSSKNRHFHEAFSTPTSQAPNNTT